MEQSIYKELNRHGGCTHDMSFTPEYRAWSGMKDRCYNINCPKFKDYGGRGIIVCDRWLQSFENFYEDMRDRPSGTTLDRVDNSEGYAPSNCRWASNTEQANNKRNNLLISYKGKKMTLMQWSKELCLNYKTLHNRLYTLGWPEDKVLATPIRTLRRGK